MTYVIICVLGIISLFFTIPGTIFAGLALLVNKLALMPERKHHKMKYLAIAVNICVGLGILFVSSEKALLYYILVPVQISSYFVNIAISKKVRDSKVKSIVAGEVMIIISFVVFKTIVPLSVVIKIFGLVIFLAFLIIIPWYLKGVRSIFETYNKANYKFQENNTKLDLFKE